MKVLAKSAGFAVLLASLCVVGAAQRSQTEPITITLAGQSMIRSDIRATAPAAGTVDPGFAEGRFGVHELRSGRRRKG